jgi:hypothetical protein
MMTKQEKPRQPSRQQSSDIPQAQGFGAIRLRAVSAATALKPKAKPAEPKRDLPPILRKDRFYD